ncbi:MAG: MFS transporter [Alicyclobacillaceae bacterium]|nr:MFS transporter [Alicyclobacillaceae bacterium]
MKKNRNYRNLWMAQVGSQFGNWFNQVALAQITLTLTHSPSAMGLVLFSGSLPAVALGPFVGPFVDRLPKKPILFITDLLRAVFALGFSLAIVFHASWVLYVDAFLLGLAGILFSPARSSAIPLVVPREDLTAANTLESSANGLLQIFGAALGGIVAVTLSPLACFAINAASYLWSALCIMRTTWEVRHEVVKRTPYFESLREGFQEAIHNRYARSIILIGISWGLAGGGYYVLIPILGQQTFHMGGLGIGILYAIDGVGVLLGSYFVTKFVGINHRRAVIWYGIAYLTQAVFFGLMTQFTVFIIGSIMLLFMRISSGVIIPLDTYMVQTSVEANKQGRVFALHGSTYVGVMQLSFAITGFALQDFGIRSIGLVIGVISLFCGVSWLAQFGRKSVISPVSINFRVCPNQSASFMMGVQRVESP